MGTQPDIAKPIKMKHENATRYCKAYKSQMHILMNISFFYNLNLCGVVGDFLDDDDTRFAVDNEIIFLYYCETHMCILDGEFSRQKSQLFRHQARNPRLLALIARFGAASFNVFIFAKFFDSSSILTHPLACSPFLTHFKLLFRRVVT